MYGDAIGASGESPHATAPPFRTLSQNYPIESLSEAFAEGILVEHPAVIVATAQHELRIAGRGGRCQPAGVPEIEGGAGDTADLAIHKDDLAALAAVKASSVPLMAGVTFRLLLNYNAADLTLEGARKLVEISVEGAKSKASARRWVRGLVRGSVRGRRGPTAQRRWPAMPG